MPTITLTQSGCTHGLSAGWTTIDASGRINIGNDVAAELAGPGVEITQIQITGRARNSATAAKRLRLGFKPALDSARGTWAAYGGASVLDSSFTAISAANVAGTYIYRTFTRTYSPTSNAAAFALFTGHIREAFAAGNPVYLGIIQPDSGKSISIYVAGYWKIAITYELLGNVPTTDVNTAAIGSAAITTTINKIVAGSSTTLRYKIGDAVLHTAEVAGTSDTYTPPVSAGAYFPASLTGTLTVEAETMLDGVSYGIISTSVTLTLPEDAAPTCACEIARIWVAGVAEAAKIGAYVQSRSGAEFLLTGAAKYGASVASYGLQVEGAAYGAADGQAIYTQPAAGEAYESGRLYAHLPFAGSGEVAYSYTVTDSRGLSRTYTGTVPVLAWSAPRIQGFNILRVTEAGTEAIDGTYAVAAVAAAASPLAVDGVEQNALAYYVQYREITEDESAQGAWISTDNIQATGVSVRESVYLTSGGVPVGGGGTDEQGNNLPFNDMAGYEFNLVVCDIYGTGSAMDEMPTKEQLWDIDEVSGNMGFGGDAPGADEAVGYRFHLPVDFVAGASGLRMGFSTSEVDTGTTWIDGKRLYAKTIVLSGTEQPSIADIVDVAETVILGRCCSVTTYNSKSYASKPFYVSSADNARVFLNLSDKVARATYGTNHKNQVAYIEILYTKTDET